MYLKICDPTGKGLGFNGTRYPCVSEEQTLIVYGKRLFSSHMGISPSDSVIPFKSPIPIVGAGEA
jgi:hypothetical protein